MRVRVAGYLFPPIETNHLTSMMSDRLLAFFLIKITL